MLRVLLIVALTFTSIVATAGSSVICRDRDRSARPYYTFRILFDQRDPLSPPASDGSFEVKRQASLGSDETAEFRWVDRCFVQAAPDDEVHVSCSGPEHEGFLQFVYSGLATGRAANNRTGVQFFDEMDLSTTTHGDPMIPQDHLMELDCDALVDEP